MQTTREFLTRALRGRISTLTAERTRVADAWLARDLGETQRWLDALTEEIEALYDRLEAWEMTMESQENDRWHAN